MTRLIAFFARQGVFADLVTLFVLIVGIASALLIRREVFPNLSFEIITVSTVLPGASPEEVEKLITNPIEQEMQEVDGIKRLTSVSTQGRSAIVAKLDMDQTTEEDAKTDIQDAVDRLAADLPEDSETPLVQKVESKLSPLVEVSISGQFSDRQLRDFAKELEKKIEKIPDVARVVHRGYRDIEIRVEADPQKLARYHLSLNDLVSSIRSQNVTVPGGSFESLRGESNHRTRRETNIKTIGDFQTPADVGATVIRANELGSPIRVRDVAQVRYELEKPTDINRTNGEPSLSLTVLKKESADAIRLVDVLKERMKEIIPGIHKDLKVTYVNDMSFYIRRRLKILTGNLTIGLVLVLLVLSLILPFRVALLVSVGIPFAFLGTLLYFYMIGISLNLISIMGLIIVLGMLVDDAIVVMENAFRKIEEGEDIGEAAIQGTQQIWAPVTASVLTTMVAFLPMMFMSGIMGKFVKYIPYAVITALIVSLIECFFILPHHVKQWIKPPRKKDKNEPKPKVRGLSRIFHFTEEVWDEKLVPAYMKSLKFVLRRRYLAAAGAIGLFIGSVIMAGTLMRFVLFPSDGIEIFFIRAEAPVGTTLESTRDLVLPIEKAVATLPSSELDDFTTRIGVQQQDDFDPNKKRGSHFAQVTVFLTGANSRSRKANAIIEELRNKIGTPAGLKKVLFERVNPGPPVGKPVSIGVNGDDYAKIIPAVRELQDYLRTLDGVVDIGDSYYPGNDEFQIKVKKAEAAAAGLNVQSIGNTVRAAYEGLVPTSIRTLDEEIDIRVSWPSGTKDDVKSIEKLLIPNSMGNLIPLSRVANVIESQGAASFTHVANERQVRVTADVDIKKTSTTEVSRLVRKKVPELQAKHGVSFDFGGGEEEETAESMRSLAMAFAAAGMGIFLILVLMFKNLFQPLLILLTIPMGIISVIWTFFLHQMPLSFMGMLGIVALAGVIVNNAIVLMDFVNQKRAEGENRWQSIINASNERIRPIFLTTLTTVFGILPTAYGIGGRDPFVIPIAMSLGWGMFFGSFLTSLIFPAAISIMDDVQTLFNKWFLRNTQAPAQSVNGSPDRTSNTPT